MAVDDAGALFLLFMVATASALQCEYEATLNITGGIEGPSGTIAFQNMTFARNQYKRFDQVLSDDGATQVNASQTRACLDNTDLPCKYADSIDISSGKRNADQSITFEHTTFASGRYAVFDYALEEDVDGTVVRKWIQPHTRGCLTNELPCDYFESVDISAGTLAEDGSVTLEHMTFPPEHYGILSYEIRNGNIRQAVKPHRRGCVCNRQACVRLCCKIGYMFVAGSGCIEHKAAAARNISMDIYTRVDGLTHTHLADHFGFVSGKSCPEYYALTKPSELNYVR